MLSELFGNKNIERVLFFLFIHGKCYGTELQRQFQTALTPLQKALERLEKGEIITSFYEGKTRIYQFNETYPLLSELKLLLKKGYMHLPQEEKRAFLRQAQDVSLFWKKLSTISTLTLTSGKDYGEGRVTVSALGENILIFSEKGKWQNEIGFTNIFRWTYEGTRISLEHLRHGIEHPVFLFHLVRDKKNSLISQDPFLCRDDCYSGKLVLDSEGATLSWKVKGPHKNEVIEMRYE